jgi:hypothetical protein
MVHVRETEYIGPPEQVERKLSLLILKILISTSVKRPLCLSAFRRFASDSAYMNEAYNVGWFTNS